MENSITEALGTVSSTLTSSINPAAIAGIIGLVLGACVVLYLTWFGIRKILTSVKGALKGKLSV